MTIKVAMKKMMMMEMVSLKGKRERKMLNFTLHNRKSKTEFRFRNEKQVSCEPQKKIKNITYNTTYIHIHVCACVYVCE